MPECYGNLDIVFPIGANGLRNTPDSCMQCLKKTDCLRQAMSKKKSGLKLQEEYVDRAYNAGMIGFLTRWSKKKQINKLINKRK